MLFITYFILAGYAIFLLIAWGAWLRLDFKQPVSLPQKLPFLTVIIPVRNEENNIIKLLQDIENQLFNKNNFEVIVVNDSSTDSTKLLVQNFQKLATFSLHLLDLPAIKNNTSPKKRAITAAIQQAKGELIVTTDGDCRVGPEWLQTIATYYHQTDTFFISSPVTFIEEKNTSFFKKVWNRIQIIEFGSLVGSAAASIRLGFPNMCSGANLAYKKSIFLDVNGYDGNEQLASGDDEFLMHKIAAKYPNKVQFLKSEKVIISTAAHSSLTSFYNQRKRWASKWKSYQNWQPTALAIFIFMVNLLTIYALFSGNWPLLLLKCGVEFLFLFSIMVFFKKTKTSIFIPFTQLIYPFYVVFFGLISQKKSKYFWKERELE